MNEIVAKHDLELAGEFFFVFARFEYALKAAGFLEPVVDARVDWRGVATAVEPIFLNPAPEEFAKAVTYILENPPNKQYHEQGSISWRPVEPQTDLISDKVLQYVRRVRNNLFHGGKFSGGYLRDPPRSDRLMKCGVNIISRCVEEIPKVQEAYFGT